MVLTTLMKGLLLMTVVGPSLAMGLFGTSSMAAGSLVVSLLYVCIFIASWRHASPSKSLAPWVVVVFFGTGILYFHGACSFFSHSAFDVARFWQSHLLLLLYGLGAYFLFILARRVSAEQADRSIKFVFWTLILSAMAGLARFSPFFSEAAFKSVLFYGEPSHFALNFLPLLLYMVVRNPGRKRLALLSGSLLLFLMLENLTLLVGFAMILCMTVRPRRLLQQLLLLMLVVFLALQFTALDYYVERLDLSSGASNLSSLVYMSGLERAYLNLVETSGLGVGFQQFGIVGSIGDAQESITMLTGDELNLRDGGWVASKFIGEFGILGVLCVLLYFVYFVRSAKFLAKASVGLGMRTDPRDVFFHSCFAMYAIDLLIRGTGYFSSSGFLFLTALCCLFLKPLGTAWRWPATASSSAASVPDFAKKTH